MACLGGLENTVAGKGPAFKASQVAQDRREPWNAGGPVRARAREHSAVGLGVGRRGCAGLAALPSRLPDGQRRLLAIHNRELALGVGT